MDEFRKVPCVIQRGGTSKGIYIHEKDLPQDPETLARMKNVGLMPLYLNSNETREYVIKTIGELKELYGHK